MRAKRCLVALAMLFVSAVEAGTAARTEASDAGADAQTQATNADTGSHKTDWIHIEDVSARADSLMRRIDAARPGPTARTNLARIETESARLVPQLQQDIADAQSLIDGNASIMQLNEARRALEAAASPLVSWKESLADEAKATARFLDDLETEQHVWTATRKRPETAAAGSVVTERVDGMLTTLAEVDRSEHEWQSKVLAVNDRIVDASASVDSMLAKLAAAATISRGLLWPDRPPLWRLDLRGELAAELPKAGGAFAELAHETWAYVGSDLRPLLAQALLAAVLMLWLQVLAARARTHLRGLEASARAAALFERPLAAGLMLALLATPVIHPLAPRRFIQFIALLAIVPAARLLLHTTRSLTRGMFGALLVVLVLDRATLALGELPLLSRLSMMVSALAALAIAIWYSRRLGRKEEKTRWPSRIAVFSVWGLSLALLANVGGWTALAAVVGRLFPAGAVAGVYVYAAVVALDAIVTYALAAPLARSRLVQQRGRVLARRARAATTWFGVAFWSYLLLKSLGVGDLATETLLSILHTNLVLGNATVSVGGVVAFLSTLLALPFLVHGVDALLMTEVFPRTELPRGIPLVLSTFIGYGMYLFGFLIALAAAGLRVTEFSILIGGLGVGVGMGLQDVVRNFAAGITVLLERRVHVGDALQIPSQEIFGRVLSIGMRATVIRNWDGAEVVIPNADLVSAPVTNWTLSDRTQRIEVPVGVSYGTDPNRVVEVLLAVAQANEDLLERPRPQALLMGFGDSSVNFLLRAWIDGEFERRMTITSELAIAVHDGLKAAGITIPFPQRDVHVVSMPGSRPAPAAPAAPAAATAASRHDEA